jgi:hypothetical protein
VDADQAADASAATDAAGPGTGAIGAKPNGNAPAGAPGSGSTAADERAQAAVATMPPAPGTRPPGTLARADIFTEPGQEAASGARNTADLAAAPPEAASHALAPPAPPSDTAEDAREQAPDTAAGPDGERSAGGLDASAETAGAAEGVAGGPGTLAQVAEVDGRAERQEAQAPLSPSSIAARPFSTALRESPGPTAPAPLRPTQRSDLDAELPGAPVAGTAAAAPTGTADAQETAHAADERTASGMGTAAPAVSDPPSARQAERDRSHESAEPGPNVAGLPAVAGVTASGAPPGVPAGSTASVVGTVAAYPAAGARAAERSAEAEAAPASEPAGARLGQGQPSLAVAGFGSAERNSPESVASAPGAPAARLADSVDGAGPAPAPARETAAPPQATASAMPPPRPLVHRPPSGAPAREAPPRAARGAVEADVPSPSSRCRTIVLMAQLGEAPSQADRSFLRDRCGARR